MKIKLLIMVMSILLLNTAANAAIITYSISGSTADFSGQFTVSSLTDTILTNPANGFGSASQGTIGYTGGLNPPFNIQTFDMFFTLGVVWNPNQTDRFLVEAASLNTKLSGNPNALWSDLIGTYALDAGNPTRYYSGSLLVGDSLGGSITFGGGGGAVATPEPGTMMLLGSGVLTFGLSRFRRRKQEPCV